MANPNATTRTTTRDGEGDDLVLVPRFRIDFKLLPLSRQRFYNHAILALQVSFTASTAGDLCINVPSVDVYLEHAPGWESPIINYGYFPSLQELLHDEMLRKQGLPGHVFIRDLSFMGPTPTPTEEDFLTARQKILKRMRREMREGGQKFLMVPFLKAEEDAQQMIQLLTDSKEEAPTIVLKGVPSDWFADQPSVLKLGYFFSSLANVRNVDTSDNNVSIQFDSREECCKALQKLCSCSLKKADSVAVYKEMDDLKHRVAMLEEELRGVKAMLKASTAAR